MKRISTVLGLALALTLALPAFAATNVIVNITGNNNSDPCNSTLIGTHSGFEITSYSLGGTDPVTIGSQSGGSGTSKGKITLSDLVISKAFSPCSGELTKNFLSGKFLPTVTLYDFKQSGNGTNFDFLTITLTDAVITSYQLSDAATTTPQESISLTYTKVCVADTPQNPNGSAGTTTTVCYNRLTNTVN